MKKAIITKSTISIFWLFLFSANSNNFFHEEKNKSHVINQPVFNTQLIITKTNIPQWQRKGDEVFGSITVRTQYPENADWFIRVVVYDEELNFLKKIDYPSDNSNVKIFNSSNIGSLPDKELKQALLNKRVLKYYSVAGDKEIMQEAGVTKIIDESINKKTIVFYNPKDEIVIPLKYLEKTTGVEVSFSRVQGTSTNNNDNESDDIVKNNESLKQSGNNDSFILNTSLPNSNLKNVRPGEFNYRIRYIGTSEVETGVFSLTKIGVIKDNRRDKLMIMINGYENQAEDNAKELASQPRDTKWDNSEISFSIIQYLTQFGIDAWYVGQPNINSVKRNAYDVAKGVEKIISLNSSVNEFFLICHSKGGLEIRALLGSNSSNGNQLNESLDKEDDPFVFENSVLNGRIKKVVFLATPHKGALVSYLASVVKPSPASNDLRPGSDILDFLNITDMPYNVSFANLTGIVTKIGSWEGDGVVSISSSENPELGNGLKAVQIYQIDGLTNILDDWKEFHRRIHRTASLSSYSEKTCNLILSNKQKIARFLVEDYMVSCNSDGEQEDLSKTLNPDLVVQDIKLSSTTVLPGDAVNVSIKNLNKGTSNAGNNYTAVWLSEDKKFDGSSKDVNLKMDFKVSSLNPGQLSNELSGNIIIPKGINAGSWYLMFGADALNQVNEGDGENNNQIFIEIMVKGANNENTATPKSKDPNCKENNTGDYCFQNNTKLNLRVSLTSSTGKISGISESFTCTLQPGQKQCFFDVPGGSARYIVQTVGNISNSPDQYYHADGSVYVDACKENSFFINADKPSYSTNISLTTDDKSSLPSRDQSCKENNTGDYCFQNNTKLNLRVSLTSSTGKISGISESFTCTLQPGQKQCFFDVPGGAARYTVQTFGNISNSPDQYYHADGLVYVDACKENSFFINADKPSYSTNISLTADDKSSLPSRAQNCKENNTGDYCFQNNTKLNLRVSLTSSTGKISGISESFTCTLQPGQKQCFFDVPGGSARYIVQTFGNISNSPDQYYHADGSLYVDGCMGKIFIIK